MKEKFHKFKDLFTTTQIILLGFLIIILTGTFTLMLPVSSASGEVTNFIDSLFMATSSVCVTGLVVEPVYEYWSVFGKTVILVLIQLGGLGFMTCFTTLLLILRKRVTLKERMVIQDSLNESGLSGLVKMVKKIIKGTFIVESIGAFLLSFVYIKDFGYIKGVCIAVFSSISAFCNAGIDIIGPASLIPYQLNGLVCMTIMCLIVSGGIGFTVWWDILRVIKYSREYGTGFRKTFAKLVLHSKLTLCMTLVLIVGGALFFFIAEFENSRTIGDMPFYGKVLNTFFQSVTTRTAGFATLYQENLTLSSQFMSVILMFIGGSTAGTAGGIKTATFAVIVFSVISVIKGKERTEVFHRTIPAEITRKALAIMVISLFVLITGTMLLSVTEGSSVFMPLLYEVASALATVGLSMDLTGSLTPAGRVLIVILMYIGRIGPITMAIAFSAKRRGMNNGIKLPEEKVLVG